ncbi:MAG: neutral zinc metallopeptidase, partial [Planctomycetales bacterium]
MRWQGGKQSDNLEDRRRMNPKAAVVGGGGMLIILLIGALLGVNPEKLQQMIGDPALNPQAQVGGGEERELNTDEERIGEFVGTILQFNEDVWSEQFRRAGETYEPPKMVLFYDSVSTGCGQAPSAVGPFYCPADRKVYLDPTFFLELEEKLGGSQAEFSQAYVISHEIGHHVQNLLGYSALVDKKRRTVSKAEYNRWSVRLELQADYLAGVWAHYGQQKFNFIEPGDI